MRSDSYGNIGESKIALFEKRASSTKSKLWTVLFSVIALFFLYKGYQWVEAYQANTAAEMAGSSNVGNIPKSTPRIEPPKKTIAPPNSASQDRATPSASDSANTRYVTKCVLNGAVSYSDGICPNGAKNSIVTLDVSKFGTVAPQVRPIGSKETTSVSPPVVSQQQSDPTFNSAPVVNFECAQLKLRIEQIDSITRQALSIQQQEWYKEERRKVRQREYDLKC